MKKLVTSVFLVFGLCSNSFSQVDTCKIDYYNMFNTDSVVSILGETDESYLFFSDHIYQRYQDKLLKLYETDKLFIHYVGNSWFEVSGFHIESPKYGIIYLSTCEAEDMFSN